MIHWKWSLVEREGVEKSPRKEKSKEKQEEKKNSLEGLKFIDLNLFS